MKYEKSRGIVLNTNLSRENDKVVIIFTEKFGKISASVPGAAKIIARLLYAIEPFCESEFEFYFKKKHSSIKVTSAVLLNTFGRIRTHWDRTLKAMTAVKLCMDLSPYFEADERKYKLLKRTLCLLETANEPSKIVLAFILRFLKYSGYDFFRYQEMHNGDRNLMAVINKFSTLPGDALDSYDVPMEICQKINDQLSIYISGIIGGH